MNHTQVTQIDPTLMKEQFEVSLGELGRRRCTSFSIQRSVGFAEEGGKRRDGLLVEMNGGLTQLGVVYVGLWVTDHPAGVGIRTERQPIGLNELWSQEAEEHRAWIVCALRCRWYLGWKETCKVDHVSTARRFMPVGFEITGSVGSQDVVTADAGQMTLEVETCAGGVHRLCERSVRVVEHPSAVRTAKGQRVARDGQQRAGVQPEAQVVDETD
mmetsp:Transcript_3821/g.9325  ORF Transcript_3821/g.9325 Transcript_3821/m.9325 type:complete len:214 (-) Transcript_3821:175-816(-)